MFLCLSKVDQLVPTVGSRVTQEYNDRYVIEREGERLQCEHNQQFVPIFYRNNCILVINCEIEL